MDTVPDEVLMAVLEHLDERALTTVARVSRRFRALVAACHQW